MYQLRRSKILRIFPYTNIWLKEKYKNFHIADKPNSCLLSGKFPKLSRWKVWMNFEKMALEYWQSWGSNHKNFQTAPTFRENRSSRKFLWMRSFKWQKDWRSWRRREVKGWRNWQSSERSKKKYLRWILFVSIRT